MDRQNISISHLYLSIYPSINLESRETRELRVTPFPSQQGLIVPDFVFGLGRTEDDNKPDEVHLG